MSSWLQLRSVLRPFSPFGMCQLTKAILVNICLKETDWITRLARVTLVLPDRGRC